MGQGRERKPVSSEANQGEKTSQCTMRQQQWTWTEIDELLNFGAVLW